MPKKIVLEFSVELPKGVVITKSVLKKGKEAFVLELLRGGKISQGKAAELLEIDRHTLFDLMAEHNIPMTNFPPEELQRQREEDEERKKEKKIEWLG